MITEKQVITYLEKNPAFFGKNLETLIKMEIPHPKGVGTISLLERQIQSARKQIDVLSLELMECIEMAEFNYMEQQKVQNFILKLFVTKNIQGIQTLFEKTFAKDFFLLEVNLIKTTKEYEQILRYLDEGVFFGQLEKKELDLLFKKKNKSIALCEIGAKAKYGLLAFSAEDERFLEDEISTELLFFIAKITEVVIKHF
jgi:uncharacterized protein YigA (DUF484 family)